MLTYNPENKTYSKFILVEELEEMKEKMRAIEDRLKNTPINPPYMYETEAELDIDDVEVLKKFLETEKFNINMAINRRRTSLFLVACFFYKQQRCFRVFNRARKRNQQNRYFRVQCCYVGGFERKYERYNKT